MTEETAKALIEAMNRHIVAMDNLAHELTCFDTYGFEDAVRDLVNVHDEQKANAWAARDLGPV